MNDDSRAGRVIAGRFRLIVELGNGNMGSVWLADHLGLGVRCAVKLMARAALWDPSSRARFQLEARAVARLQSPHVVRVLDYDVDDDTPFIAMELLQGEELAARIARRGPLGPATTYAMVAAIAQGLSKAHAVGIVHRDLKPENIFLADTDEGEIVKILDFGIAKVNLPGTGTGTGTLAGEVLGTPQYMSPEQVRGATTIDHRSDLWSLAVVTYQCLLGQLPFDGPMLGNVFAQIVADPIPIPSHVAPPGVRVPVGFDRWWSRAVSRDVDRRFASAQELVEALKRALDDEADVGKSSPDITTPPIAMATKASDDEPVELPMRSGWRSRMIVLAVAAGVAAVAMLGYARSTRSTRGMVSSEAPVAAAAAAPIAPASATPAASASVDEPPRLPDASETVAASIAIPRASAAKSRCASCALHAGGFWKAQPRRPPPIETPAIAPIPAAPEKTPPAAATVAPATRPSDDVDFGI